MRRALRAAATTATTTTASRAPCRAFSAPPTPNTARYLALEDAHGSHNYHPLPVVFERALGVDVWDVDGKRYLDCLSAYSAVNQGHCHPRLVAALVKQASRLTLSSRAFCSDQLGPYAAHITSMFGYDRVLPMNTGVEAWETALKLTRRWGYVVKGIPDAKAVVIVARGAFHGRTMAAISASDDPESYGGFGPWLPGMVKVDYGCINSLKAALAAHGHSVAGFIVEPVQGEAGVVVPPPGYLAAAAAACAASNVLFVADEVQTGLCRTGSMLCVDAAGVRPDIVILGKALSGGVLPVSAVLADDAVMLNIHPGQHGSTFGGNPLGCAVASEALRVLVDEGLAEAATIRGAQLKSGLAAVAAAHPRLLAPTARGQGLLTALEVRPDAAAVSGKHVSAWDICMELKEGGAAGVGVLAKPTHDTVIRMSPPLVISEAQVNVVLGVLDEVLTRLEKA